MYKIPLFDVNIDEKEEQAVVATLRSGWLSQGERCLEFEKMFAEKLGVKHALSLTNCTVALHLAMLALDIGVDDEVICPSYSFVASVNCIKYVGAKPVFADITSTTNLNINPAEIEKKITPKTKAIVVVHFAGFPCDMNAIMSFAQKNNLKVIVTDNVGNSTTFESVFYRK